MPKPSIESAGNSSQRSCHMIAQITAAATIGIRKIQPPIVGVPCFFRWLCGPSSRSDWPNFSRRISGITTGPSRTPAANTAAMQISISYTFI